MKRTRKEHKRTPKKLGVSHSLTYNSYVSIQIKYRKKDTGVKVMKLINNSIAGTLESSDIQIIIEPKED